MSHTIIGCVLRALPDGGVADCDDALGPEVIVVVATVGCRSVLCQAVVTVACKVGGRSPELSGMWVSWAAKGS